MYFELGDKYDNAPELCMSTARNPAGPRPSAVHTRARSTLLCDTTRVTSEGSSTMSLHALCACSNTRWMGLKPSISNSPGFALQSSAPNTSDGTNFWAENIEIKEPGLHTNAKGNSVKYIVVAESVVVVMLLPPCFMMERCGLVVCGVIESVVCSSVAISCSGTRQLEDSAQIVSPCRIQVNRRRLFCGRSNISRISRLLAHYNPSFVSCYTSKVIFRRLVSLGLSPLSVIGDTALKDALACRGSAVAGSV